MSPSRRAGERPALDALLKDAKRRRFDVLVCWRLDRLGRNLRHLVKMLEDLNHVGVAFVSLGKGIDCTTPAGKLQLHILAALAEFERERIKERVIAGMARAKGTRQARRSSREPRDCRRPRCRRPSVGPGGRVSPGRVEVADCR